MPLRLRVDDARRPYSSLADKCLRDERWLFADGLVLSMLDHFS